MRIETLFLKNFRGIEELHLNFADSQTTVLVGVNGAGKSSILDAVAIMLAYAISALSWKKSSSPRGDDRAQRELRFGLNSMDIKNGCDECSIRMSLSVLSAKEEWKLGLKSISWKSVEGPYIDGAFLIFSEKIRQLLDKHPDSNIPIIVYDPADRRVSAIPLGLPEDYDFHQLTAYNDAVASKLEFIAFFEWYRAREDFENEQLRTNPGHRDKQLEAVRNAIYRLLPGFSDLRVRRSPRLGMILKKQGQELDLHQLSDGEKCLLAMVGDIARRLAIASPSLDDPLSGEGIVLIDEIDLHLHPGWQRRVIPGLERAFPNCQFIVATHSPQVLSSAKSATVYLLMVVNGSMKAKRLPGPYGKDTNWILEELMGVTERPPEVQDKILEYFERIESGELVEAEELRQALALDIGEEDPELVRGAVVTRRKEILKK
jgi:predicted ATP-binding protein involved in virulence